MQTFPIYLDNCATTRVDPRVLDAMLPYFCEHYGNAASRSHEFGWKAEEAVQTAQEQIAALIGVRPREIVVTSGATESNNVAIKGVAWANRHRGNHIITGATEHKSVLDTCEHLRRKGFQVTILPVDRFGRVAVQQVEEALGPKTILVSLMAANNETGTLHPIAEIGELCRQRGVLFHADATQLAGKLPLDAKALHVDLMSYSAHKMYGPKGIGALYVRRKAPPVELEPLIHGGGHQGGLRSGTLPVPMIVGFGASCELALDLRAESERLRRLRDRLESGILALVPNAIVNGHPLQRSPIVTNISFADADGESLLVDLKHVAASSGSACTSASAKPSYVLNAMGVEDHLAKSSLRLSVGRFTTEEEIEIAIKAVATAAAGFGRDDIGKYAPSAHSDRATPASASGLPPVVANSVA